MYYTILSTKGGVGKTTIAQQLIAPFIHHKNGYKAEIIELDNNNESNVLKQATTQFTKTLTLQNSEDILLEKFIDVVNDKDVVIDVGGGDDTKAVLKAFKSNRIDDEAIFIIPVLKDLSNQKNVIDTYKLIRTWNKKAKVIFIFNKWSNEDEFSGIISELEKQKLTNYDVFRLQETHLFDEIAKEFQKPLYEITLEDLGDIKTAMKELALKKDIKKLKEFKRWVSIYDECLEYRKKNLDLLFKELL